MSGDGSLRTVRRTRTLARPQVVAGPLRELKNVLYELYLRSGPPTLDDIAAWVAADDNLVAAPQRDTIHRVLGSSDIPASIHDAVAVGSVLAQAAGQDPLAVAEEVRQLWVRARMASPLGHLISELTDPFALEVHPAIDAGAKAAGMSPLPFYVERDHDERLAEIADAAAAGGSGIAVLVGESSTGKTRACWQAIHRLPVGWRLWHPIDPGRPEAADAAVRGVGPRTVIWLNDAQHYLLTQATQLGERVAAGLRELLRDPHRAPVLVLATMWPQYYAVATSPPIDGRNDVHAQARALLIDAAVDVPAAFTGKALVAVAEAAGHDPRLADARRHATDGLITQFLAGTPALVERYRTAPAAARALLDAAIDIRRLGHSVGLPHGLLEHAAPAYLTDEQWDGLREDWLEYALTYATAQSRGARGPLTRIRPRPSEPVPAQPHYRLADQLDQMGRARRAAESVPAAAWLAIQHHARREDLPAVAAEAHRRHLYQTAFRLYEAAALSGDQAALRRAADILSDTFDTVATMAWLRTMCAQPLVHCPVWAVNLLLETEEIDQARQWLEQLDQPVEAEVLLALAHALRDHGQHGEAVVWYLAAADAGAVGADCDAADLLLGLEQPDDALTCYTRAANAAPTSIRLLTYITDQLSRRGHDVEAIKWLNDRVTTGDSTALVVLADLLADLGRVDEAIDALQHPLIRDERRTLERLGPLLERIGRHDDAVAAHQRAVAAGDPSAVARVVDLLVALSRTEEAIEWVKRRAENGDSTALPIAVELLRSVDRIDEALTWLQAVAKHEDHGIERHVVALFAELGRPDQAIEWLRGRAEAGNPAALGLAASLLRELGRTDEAIAAYQAAADTGAPAAAWRAVSLLRQAGRLDEATKWLLNRTSVPDRDTSWRVAGLFRDAGRIDDAITYYQVAAEHGNVHALQAAAILLVENNRSTDAAAWLRTSPGGNVVAAAGLLSIIGDLSGSITLYQAAAEAGDDAAISDAVQVMRKKNASDAAIEWLRRCTDIGIDSAIEPLASLYRETGRVDEATTWLHELIRAGNLAALPRLADHFDRHGNTAEAIEAWKRAAEAGVPGALNRAVTLLRRSDRIGEANQLRRYGLSPGAHTANWTPPPA